MPKQTDNKSGFGFINNVVDNSDYNQPFDAEVNGRDVEGWTEKQRGFYTKLLLPFCESVKISKKIAKRIMNQYNTTAIDMLQEDPFAVIKDVPFYTLDHAEKIARFLGIGQNDPRRLRGYIYHAMNKALGSGGDTKIKAEKLHRQFVTLFPNGDYDKALSVTSLFELGDGWLTIDSLYSREQSIAGLVGRVCEPLALEQYPADANEEQRQALRNVFYNPVSIVNGLGGTGKTFIIYHIVRIARSLGLNCVLLAPTGKAQRKANQAVGFPASTIHKFLYSRMASQKAKESEYDVVIVDEGYMADSNIVGWLVDEIEPFCKHLVFLGDPNQLPPVGAGQPVTDMSNHLPVTTLVKNYRSNKVIQHNCQCILNGDLEVMDYSQPEQWAWYDKGIMAYIADPQFANRTLITVGASGKFGATRLNFLVQRHINPDGQAIVYNPYINRGDFCELKDDYINTRNGRTFQAGAQARVSDVQKRLNNLKVEFYDGGEVTIDYNEYRKLFHHQKVFRLGDKVMQTVNDYDKNIDNGDVGIVVEVYRNYMVVEYAPRRAGGIPHRVKHKKEKNLIENLVLCYVLNTHKVQGDEYENISFLIDKGVSYFLKNRELFYTALSRGKKSVHIVGDYEAMVGLKHAKKRNTMIEEIIRDGQG